MSREEMNLFGGHGEIGAAADEPSQARHKVYRFARPDPIRIKDAR